MVPTPMIHPTACIDPTAKVHPSAVIGPYTVIGPECVVEAGVRIASHCVLERYTILREGVTVHAHAVLGGDPQDTKYEGERSWLEVGPRTRVGEFASLHRATGQDQWTRVGADCFLMAYAHVGHNVTVMDHVTIGNGAQLGGHSVVEPYALMAASSGVHQHCRVGRLAMLSAYSGVRMDVPPFVTVDGVPAEICGLNVVGMRRSGLSSEHRQQLRQAIKRLFYTPQARQDILADLKPLAASNPFLADLVTFLEAPSKRGITCSRNKRKFLSQTVEGGEL
jgi:UDP-N-acetylglucosamine acyltransferase